MAERIVHRWSGDPKSLRSVCGLRLMSAHMNVEVAADLRRTHLPRGGRWCRRCVRG